MGYSNRINDKATFTDFTAFVPTFTDFSRVYRLLATFIEFFDFKNVFWHCSNLLSLRLFIVMHQNLRLFLYRLPVNRSP
jgi:hypothetical protein